MEAVLHCDLVQCRSSCVRAEYIEQFSKGSSMSVEAIQFVSFQLALLAAVFPIVDMDIKGLLPERNEQ